jgi:hypothetical protein
VSLELEVRLPRARFEISRRDERREDDFAGGSSIAVFFGEDSLALEDTGVESGVALRVVLSDASVDAAAATAWSDI